MKYIQEILPCLITMLDFNDKQIKADTCWAFSYITDGPNERIQYVLDVSRQGFTGLSAYLPENPRLKVE